MRFKAAVILIPVVTVISGAHAGAAMPGGDQYTMEWHTIDGGGGVMTSGDLSLEGTIGQPELGPMRRGRLRFYAGFWGDGPVDDISEVASVFDFEIITGTLLSGDLSDLEAADDLYLHTRSGFGTTFIDLHHMEMRILATATLEQPTLLDVRIEARINEPAGIAQVRAYNWLTEQYDSLGQYALGSSDAIQEFAGLDASKYVSPLGEIDVTTKHIVFRPFFAYFFESFIDQIELVVHE